MAFDEDEFDCKVMRSICIARNRNRRAEFERRFDVWYEDNYDHLVNMYDLSGVDWEFEKFCRFVFVHSL